MNLEIRQAIVTRLINQLPSETAISVGNRVTYGLAPSDTTFPYITIHTISDKSPNESKKRGRDLYYDVRCMATSSTQAKELEEAVKACLDDYAIVTTSWASYRHWHTNSYDFLEQQERIQVYKHIGEYRLTLEPR